MNCQGGASQATVADSVELPAVIIHFEDDNLLTTDMHPYSDLLSCGTIQGDVSL